VATWAGVSEVIGDDLTDVEFLARGGNGSVFRARQASLGRVVALKVPDGDPRDGRLSDEARTQAAMSWHGNVVTLLGTTILADDRPALVLEYVPGGTLAERIRRRGTPHGVPVGVRDRDVRVRRAGRHLQLGGAELREVVEPGVADGWCHHLRVLLRLGGPADVDDGAGLHGDDRV
jgi:serine/threonine protein kinase